MVTSLDEEIRKLQTYTNVSFPIMSLYLEVSESRDSSLVNQFKEFVEGLTREEKETFKTDIISILGLLRAYPTNTYKSIAIFSGGGKLWEIAPTYLTLPSLLAINHSPYLDPLLRKLSQAKRFLVIVADRKKAKFFTMHSGMIENQQIVIDKTVPQKMKGHGLLQKGPNIERHVRNRLHKHLDFIASKANEFIQHIRISGVVVGGHKELIHRVEEHLSKNLQDKIIGEFTSEVNVSIKDIAQKSRLVLQKTQPQFLY